MAETAPRFAASFNRYAGLHRNDQSLQGVDTNSYTLLCAICLKILCKIMSSGFAAG
jgi:hypothetical protein